MTLGDVLLPSATVLLHANIRGIQVGGAIGATLAIPAMSLQPSLANASDKPPLVCIAHLAGVGAVTCATVISAVAIRKLVTSDLSGIRERANNLRNNVEQTRIDRISSLGALGGLALWGVRVKKVAELERIHVCEVACNKQGAWEAFCFSVLGAVVTVGAVKVGEKAAAKVRCIWDKSCNDEESVEQKLNPQELVDDVVKEKDNEEDQERKGDGSVKNETS